MNHDEKAREYAARLKALAAKAREVDIVVFTVSGGRRIPYTLTVTVLPQTFELDDPRRRNPRGRPGDNFVEPFPQPQEQSR
jgi:hypothetical protein